MYMTEEKNKKWVKILKAICQFLLTVLTAAGTAFGMEACVMVG